MINSLKIKNFKPFQSQEFNLKPLTLLSGLNSTGKSSMIQALLLLRQSYQQKFLLDKGLSLKGNLVNIGTAKNVLFDGDRIDDIISFSITLEDQTQYDWDFQYDSISNILKFNSSSVPDNYTIYKSSLFNQNFHYLQAERISPQIFFEMSDYDVRDQKQLGAKGEYTAHFISINEDQKIIDNKLSHPNVKESLKIGEEPKKSLYLKDQIQAWMGDISPGVELNLKEESDLELINIQYSYGDDNLYRSTNVGFGITYILPIITAILSAKKDSLIILENPEAHLHPKGQSRIGQLIALASSCGIQIIVETHSDHILNGIRRIVKKQQINSEDVAIYYFQREKKDNRFETKIISPKIYQDGGIDQWPDGFFDQAENDLMELL